jgi:hypothetical protein
MYDKYDISNIPYIPIGEMASLAIKKEEAL